MKKYVYLLVAVALFSVLYWVLLPKKYRVYYTETEKVIEAPVRQVFDELSAPQAVFQWLDAGKGVWDGDYFHPYSGAGAAASVRLLEKGTPKYEAQIFLRQADTLKNVLFYQLYTPDMPKSVDIRITMKKLSEVSTGLSVKVKRPDDRLSNIFSFGEPEKNADEAYISHALEVWKNDLKHRVSVERDLGNIVRDSIFSERTQMFFLLGSVSSFSKKQDTWGSSVEIAYNKAKTFITNDLGLKPNQTGNPVMIVNTPQFSRNGSTYMLGYPLKEKKPVDNYNFVFTPVEEQEVYAVYHEGSIREIPAVAARLLKEIKNNEKVPGKLMVEFLSPPEKDASALMKISVFAGS